MEAFHGALVHLVRGLMTISVKMFREVETAEIEDAVQTGDRAVSGPLVYEVDGGCVHVNGKQRSYLW